MLTTFPMAWLLVALPFISAIVISQVPALRRLAATRYRLMWPIGVVGLAVLLLELTGELPAGSAVPVMFLAGALSGFSLFWGMRPGGDGDGGDWRWGPPGEGPPPDPPGDGPLDWELFDRLRGQWERVDAGGLPRASRRRSRPGAGG